jgi:hypothetical protein
MLGAIFYKNYEEGYNMLVRLKGVYIYHLETIRSERKDEIRFSNGDVWKLVPATLANTCGHRYQIAYVERAIDEKIFHSIIMPCLTLGPFTAFNFYGEGDLKVSDQVELPF